MSDEPKELRPGMRMRCQNKDCRAFVHLTDRVTLSEEPVTLECKLCGHQIKVTDRTVFPKIDVKELFTGEISPVQESIAPRPASTGPKSMRKLTEELADIALAGLTKVREIKAEVSKVERAMTMQFEEAWTGSELMMHWDAGYVAEFVTNPFLKFPVESFDPNIRDYCAYIVAPRFFSPRLGIPCKAMGNMTIEATSPYSRLSGFPVPDSLADKMKLPMNFELEVYGRKIVGHGLPGYWRDIPGITEDDDHRPDMPSVRMTDAWQARMWLAKHGVQPWQSVSCAEDGSLAKGGIFAKESGKMLPAHHYDAWKRFLHHGRLMLNWYDVADARLVAAQIATMFFGPKMFIAYDERMAEEWRRLLFHGDLTGAMWHAFMRGSKGYLNPEFITNTEIPLLIVDCSFGPDDDLLDALMLYSGKLIIVMDDPQMDTYKNNIVAPKYHALVAHTMIDQPDCTKPLRRSRGNLETQTLADVIEALQARD